MSMIQKEIEEFRVNVYQNGVFSELTKSDVLGK